MSARSLLAVAAFVPVLLGAQAPRLTRVKVVDAEGTPVPFASVSVDARDAEFTGSDGVMSSRFESKDQARLWVRRMGYKAVDRKVVRDTSGVFLVEMEPVVMPVDAVTVTVRRDTPLNRTGFYSRAHDVSMGKYSGQFWGPEELEQASALRMSDLLNGSRYVRVVTNGMSVKLLGRGNCEFSLLLDGRWVRPPLDEATNAGALMGVEVYPSYTAMPIANLPPMANTSCGIIVMWTGPRH